MALRMLSYSKMVGTPDRDIAEAGFAVLWRDSRSMFGAIAWKKQKSTRRSRRAQLLQRSDGSHRTGGAHSRPELRHQSESALRDQIALVTAM